MIMSWFLWEMIIIGHIFIIINMLVIIEFYHSGLIQSLVDGHLHLHTYICITVLGPLAFNYDYGFFCQNVTFPVLV